MSPGGEGPPGPGGHPLRLVPGSGLHQFHRGAAHRGSLPGSGPCAQPETEAGPGRLSLDASLWWKGDWPGASWTHLGGLWPPEPSRPPVEARLWTELRTSLSS